MSILLTFSQNSNAAFENDSVLNIVFWWWSKNLEKWKDEKGVFTAVLTDLSKTFVSIPHQLFIAKLSAYGFDMKS